MNNYLNMKKIVIYSLVIFLLFLPVVSGLNDAYTLCKYGIGDKYYTKDIKYVDPKIIADTYISMSTSVAYIYSSDKTSAYSYKSLLDSNGFSTTLISISNVDVTDFSKYSVIIIGPDINYLSSWDDDKSVSNVEESDKPIIGLGEGGYAFFGYLKLKTGHPNGWHGHEKSVYIMDSQNTIFLTPDEITIPKDKILQLYTSSRHVGIYLPSIPPNILVLGREADNKNHYSLTLEKDKYLLWGFTASPDSMTNVGSNLFINVVNYMISLSAPQSGTIKVHSNLEDATFTISGPDSYSGSGISWSQLEVPQGDYTITYGSVSGYKTPASETKTLSSGGLISFDGHYDLKRMVGESIDHGNGYISYIKEIDQRAGVVMIELQLDKRTINKNILTAEDSYVVKEYNKDPYSFLIDIDQENSDIHAVFIGPFSYKKLDAYHSLIVDSDPQRADVLIDNKYVGKTKKNIPIIDQEMHILRLELNGYEPNETTFKFEPGEDVKEMPLISLEGVNPIETLAPCFSLNISSIPTGAKIFIDEKYVGRTPQKKYFSDFNLHSLKLVLNGYKTNESTFKFEPGEEEKEMPLISLEEVNPIETLAPCSILNISSIPTGAKIFIDGKYVGRTPLKNIYFSDFNLHSLKLVLDGYETNETTFKFKPGEEEKEITISLDKVRSTFEPTITRPGGEGLEPTPTPTLTSITPSSIKTPTSLASKETQKEPGFLAILAIVTILCGYLAVKKW